MRCDEPWAARTSSACVCFGIRTKFALKWMLEGRARPAPPRMPGDPAAAAGYHPSKRREQGAGARTSLMRARTHA